MLITIMRHGEAQFRAASDSSRQLTEQGRKDNLATTSALLSHNPEFSHALHSPYLRAQQTAEDLCTSLGGLASESCEMLTPDVPVTDLLSYLQHFCEERQVSSLLLVGHNPLLSHLLSLLLDGTHSGARHLDTSNLVCLNVDLLAPACAEINYWLRADS